MIIVSTTGIVPLEVTVTRQDSGGISGLLPTVALRDEAGLYLDFSDSIFKNIGWTTKYQVMTEIERGHYEETWPVVGVSSGSFLFAEYRCTDSGLIDDDEEEILIADLNIVNPDISLIKKILLNRCDAAPGNPGTMTWYEDDSATVLLIAPLRDYQGNAVKGIKGIPARRGKAT